MPGKLGLIISGVLAIVFMVLLDANAKDLSHEEITPKMGPIVSIGDKEFFAELYPKRNWSDASARCQSFGLKLASITSQAEYDALNSTYNFPDFFDGFWTSGRDAQELRQFSWNETSQEPPEGIVFKNAFPAVRSCMGFQSDPEDSFLFSYDCSLPDLGAICELVRS